MTTFSGMVTAKAAFLLLATMAIYSVVEYDEMLEPFLRGETAEPVRAPASPEAGGQRHLTINLGGGECEYELPIYDVPNGIDFHKTLIAGYPSGDKRMIFVQMEALTGWAAKDEWDFEFLGNSNHPFIKGNYPHHEGIWGWGNNADQMVLMIRNMRRSMVEYHDILWDIDYAKTWDVATENMMNLYMERAPLDEFLVWRDDRVMDEVHWYGWEIDFWMEGGLLRDMFTHGITTEWHWNKTMLPVIFHRHDLEVMYETHVRPGVEDGSIGPTYERHCAGGAITDGCEPVAVISAEVLRDYTTGPSETEKIANVLLNDDRMGRYVIDQEAWDCVWEELIIHKKGLKTVYDRPGFNEHDYNFSAEMLEHMIWQLDRLIAKYGGPEWNTKATANRVVDLLSGHRVEIQAELDEVKAGTRKLTSRDFLGRKERERRRKLAAKENPGAKPDVTEEKKDYSKIFMELEKKLKDRRDSKRRQSILAASANHTMDGALEKKDYTEFIMSLKKKLTDNKESKQRQFLRSESPDHSMPW